MADHVGNRVGLSSTGWSLYDNTIVTVELLHDGDLFVVVRHREIKLKRLRPCIARGEAAEELLRSHAHRRVTALDKTADDAGQFGGSLNSFLKSSDVFKEDVARTLPSKEHPRARNLERVAGHGRHQIFRSSLVDAGRVQVTHCRFEDVLEGRGIKRIDPMGATGQRALPECFQLPHAWQFHLGVAIGF